MTCLASISLCRRLAPAGNTWLRTRRSRPDVTIDCGALKWSCIARRSRVRPAFRPATYSTTNMAACYNVVEAAVLYGARRLVYASSMSVLGYPFFEQPVIPSYLPFDSSASDRAAGRLCSYRSGLARRSSPRQFAGGRIFRQSVFACHGSRPPRPFRATIVERRRHAALVARDLWGYFDVRDAAAAFVAAAERQLGAIVASSSVLPTPSWRVETRKLVQAAYPGVELRRPLTGYETVFDLTEARYLLGFEAQHGWRDY